MEAKLKLPNMEDDLKMIKSNISAMFTSASSFKLKLKKMTTESYLNWTPRPSVIFYWARQLTPRDQSHAVRPSPMDCCTCIYIFWRDFAELPQLAHFGPNWPISYLFGLDWTILVWIGPEWPGVYLYWPGSSRLVSVSLISLSLHCEAPETVGFY